MNCHTIIRLIKSKKIESKLLILDDIFPNPYSDWRNNEYVTYLEKINDTKIITGSVKNNSVFLPVNYNKHREDFLAKFPLFKDCVMGMKPTYSFRASLGYCLFYNNLKYSFPIYTKYKIPFVFTLYPGGGFSIYNNEFESNLRIYFKSDLFRHVIVNMPHVYDYLKDRFDIKDDKISLIYGAPLNLPNVVEQSHDLSKKIRIVFSSHKYSQNGFDKGFDVFNLVAKALENDDRFEFTSLGGFSKEDLVVQTKNIKFHPKIEPDLLSSEFVKYDIVLSPNRSNALHPGSFDGFPTGSVIHAANCECLMMLTDDWSNASRISLFDNIDYIRISTNVDEIVTKLKLLAKEPTKISCMAKNGKQKLINVLNIESQLKSRLHILRSYL